MIQQMIYKGTANGYKTVAFSNGLERTSLINRLEMMCRVPGTVWTSQKTPCPIYARYEVDGGYAYSATEKDVHDERDRGLTHIIYIPKDECASLSKQTVPISAFIREYEETENKQLPELDINKITNSMNGKRFFSSVKELFSDEKSAAAFFESVYRFVRHNEDKNIRGICVLLGELNRTQSEAAFNVMESLTRIFKSPDSNMPGYRTMWTGPDNNIQYPIFFTSPLYMPSADVLSGLRYILVDTVNAETRLSRSETIVAGKEIVSFAESVFKSDFEAFIDCLKSIESMLKEESRKKEKDQEKKQKELTKEKQKNAAEKKKNPETKNIEEKSTGKKADKSSIAAKSIPDKEAFDVQSAEQKQKLDVRKNKATEPLYTYQNDIGDISLNTTIRNDDFESVKAYVEALFKEVEAKSLLKRSENLNERIFGIVQKKYTEDPESAIQFVDKATHNIRIVADRTNPKSEEFVRLSKYMHFLAEAILSDLLLSYEKRKIKNILIRVRNIRTKRRFNERWFLKWTPYLNSVFQKAEQAHFKAYYKDYRIILSDDGVDILKQETARMRELFREIVRAAESAPEKDQMQRLYETAVLLFAYSRVQVMEEDGIRYNMTISDTLNAYMLNRGFRSFKRDFLMLVKMNTTHLV